MIVVAMATLYLLGAFASSPQTTLELPVDGRLVGLAAAYPDRDRGKARHKAWLVAVDVAPEARGRGIGRAVCQAAVDRARTWEGVEQVHLGVAATNESAVRLYESMGFIE